MSRAKERFWRTVTSDWRAWICLAVCGLGGIAGGASFSWGHGRSGVVFWTVLWAAIGLLMALVLIFVALWASASQSILREDIAAVREQVARLEAQLGGGAGPLRIALIAVRSELATNAIKIRDALTVKRWWIPQHKLTADVWAHPQHSPALADPALPPTEHAAIERAYQHCHALNQRIERYHAEQAEGHPFAMMVKRSYGFREGDEDELRAVKKQIDAVNTAISNRVDQP